ncbi:MAG: response regulator [Alcanivoracaceae bacterium]|nr:response regulator [Alcanivoracaceae bacterium]
MQIFLQNYSLKTDVAESAEKGIELASTTKYDLIFLDIVLPEMNGYKACKLLKLAPTSFNTPVVMLTGKSSTFNKLRGVMAGCDQYLTKPVNGSRLLSVLKKYIPVLKKNKNILRRK